MKKHIPAFNLTLVTSETTLLSLVTTLLLGFGAVYADDAEKSTQVSATYMIGGLHCPPCARTIESSLGRIKGIQSAKVDWASKTVKLQFDESAISATQIADAVARTPHMMGGGMKYSGRLALSVPAVRDQATANAAVEALRKVPGVAKVNPFPGNHTVAVQFDAGAKLTSSQLIHALDEAGMPAKTF